MSGRRAKTAAAKAAIKNGTAHDKAAIPVKKIGAPGGEAIKAFGPPSNPLAQFKTKTGLTDEEIAKLLDLDRSYVLRLRRGEREPSMATARKIQKRTNGAVPVQAWLERECAG